MSLTRQLLPHYPYKNMCLFLNACPTQMLQPSKISTELHTETITSDILLTGIFLAITAQAAVRTILSVYLQNTNEVIF